MRAQINKSRRLRSVRFIGPFALIATIMSCCRCIPAQAQTSPKYPGAAGQVIDKITVIGAKALAPSTVLVLGGVRIGDASTEQNLEEIRTRLINTGVFGIHNPDDQDEWVRLRVETVGYPAGHCELLVVVDENDKVTAADIVGAGPISTDDLLPKLHIGSVYNSGRDGARFVVPSRRCIRAEDT